MQIDPVLSLVILVGLVAAFAVGKWWALRRPDEEVIALKTATKLLSRFTVASTPEGLAAAQARETLRKETIAAFKAMVEKIQ